MRMDVEGYKAQTQRLDLSDVDFGAFRSSPLPDAALRCIRYMHDIEHHTVCYLRDLLVTPVHRDPEITTFLTFWNFEEFWHGEALGLVLQAHGEPAGTSRIARLRRAMPWKERLAPLAHSLGSSLAGESFTAIHMTWGAVNEWSTQAGYARLTAQAGHPVLTELLRRIMRQEGRHIDFYASEAHRRLEADRRAQRLTRFALRKLWRPVGATIKPRADVAALISYLFGDEPGREMARRIDRRIDRLPGLSGLGLAEGAVDQYAAVA